MQRILKTKLTREKFEKDIEIKSLQEQLRETNLLNLNFRKSAADLENIFSHQRDPIDRRGIEL